MARIYVASSWRNEYQPDVVSCLRGAGHLVYDFKNPPFATGFGWSEIDPGWKDWKAIEYRHHLYNHPRCAQGYLSDYRAMEWADTCVLLLPSGRSAHLEAGWFAGRGKRLVIMTKDGEEPELMALMANHICISIQETLRVLA